MFSLWLLIKIYKYNLRRLLFDKKSYSDKDIEIIAAYETLSETHWNAPFIESNFTPNMVVNIEQEIEKKLDALRCYKSQIEEASGPRSIKAVKALAEFRGTQSGFNYGEAFYVIRISA